MASPSSVESDRSANMDDARDGDGLLRDNRQFSIPPIATLPPNIPPRGGSFTQHLHLPPLTRPYHPSISIMADSAFRHLPPLNLPDSSSAHTPDNHSTSNSPPNESPSAAASSQIKRKRKDKESKAKLPADQAEEDEAERGKRTKTQRACDPCRRKKIRFVLDVSLSVTRHRIPMLSVLVYT